MGTEVRKQRYIPFWNGNLQKLFIITLVKLEDTSSFSCHPTGLFATNKDKNHPIPLRHWGDNQLRKIEIASQASTQAQHVLYTYRYCIWGGWTGEIRGLQDGHGDGNRTLSLTRNQPKNSIDWARITDCRQYEEPGVTLQRLIRCVHIIEIYKTAYMIDTTQSYNSEQYDWYKELNPNKNTGENYKRMQWNENTKIIVDEKKKQRIHTLQWKW